MVVPVPVVVAVAVPVTGDPIMNCALARNGHVWSPSPAAGALMGEGGEREW